MPIESADTLIHTLRGCGLFSAEQMSALVGELAPVGDDPAAAMRHLVARDLITVYQLRKVAHGKAAELFFGDYVVLDKLGEGGMGKVYKARQNRLGREVAIKIVRSSLLSNPLVRKRYEREVQAASHLQHPNIVSVFDAGEVFGRYYLAMEFVDGIDLSRLIRDHGVLSVQEACEYARQAALGLQHAHDRGFVHRDIKPSNIIVSGERHVPKATEPAFVKILDMGLVREIGFDDGPAGADVTRDGTVVGTPDYMAPEQAKNSSGVDHRADLYSLGCTLYFLLTGQPPFPGGTPIERLLKHQLDRPDPLQGLRPGVPDAVAELVARLMAKNPDDRPATAGEVAAALGPHARYPHGTAPVTILTRGSEQAAPRADTPPAGTTYPPSGPDSS
ncbi:MAG TPA: serine/threonine-protein kinase, partial [Gemmataceae bacterium]|nr:serine/threonine-protein kinase [Gemmataceae bacterium]